MSNTITDYFWIVVFWCGLGLVSMTFILPFIHHSELLNYKFLSAGLLLLLIHANVVGGR